MKRKAAGQRARDVAKGGDFFDLKKAGVAVIHVHGNRDVAEDAEIEERKIYRVPAEYDGETKRKPGYDTGHKRLFYAMDDDENPMQDFLDALQEDDSIEDSTAVLFADGVEYTKGDIVGNGDWKLKLLPGTEFLWAVVVSSVRDEKTAKPTVQILRTPPSLCEAIDKVIDAQVREHGEEDGEASIAGYGIEIEYDKDAPASKMYSARYNGRKPSDRVQDLLDGPGIDLSKFCGPPKVSEMRALIAAALLVEIDGLDIEPESVRETRGGRRRGGADEDEKPKSRASKRRTGRRRPAKDDEKKPAKKRGKKKPPPEPEPDDDDEPDEVEDDEVEDDEEPDEEEPESYDEDDEDDEEPDEEEEELPPEPEPPKKKRGKKKPAKSDDEKPAKKETKKRGKKKPAKSESSGAADEVEVTCPECGETVKVSSSQKDCSECGHKIIPW